MQKYHCYICNPGATSWTDITGKSLAQVAVSAKWDVITIQEHTGRLLAWGWTDDEKNAVNGLLSKLKDAQDAQGGTPKYYYILSQAYFDLSKAQNVSKPFSDQAGMWKAISDQARKVMLECTFDGIISTGAMLQNLRTSGINDEYPSSEEVIANVPYFETEAVSASQISPALTGNSQPSSLESVT